MEHTPIDTHTNDFLQPQLELVAKTRVPEPGENNDSKIENGKLKLNENISLAINVAKSAGLSNDEIRSIIGHITSSNLPYLRK